MLDGNGANLSQGQRQLLSIARAAVKDAPVMILDEATSSIDTRTEKLVQDGTGKLMEGRTVFVIAHRLSTVQNSDAIMVLDHGRRGLRTVFPFIGSILRMNESDVVRNDFDFFFCRCLRIYGLSDKTTQDC